MKILALKNFIFRSNPTTFLPCIQRHRHQKSYSTYDNFGCLDEVGSRITTYSATYPQLKAHLLKKIDHEPLVKHFETLLDYQVGYGRQSRSAILLAAANAMNPEVFKKKPGTEDAMLQVHAMAWLNDVLHGGILILDDLLDRSKLRRGRLPWYLIAKENFVSVDIGILFYASSLLLMDFAEDAPFYKAAMRLLQENAAFGILVFEAYDMFNSDSIRSRNISMKNFEFYAVKKAIYTLELPFKLGVYVATNSAFEFDKTIDEILVQLSIYFQIQNDMTNFDNVALGKPAFEDIIEGKISWPLVYVMERATEDDINIILENYGKESEKCIHKVLSVFNKFDLKKHYLEYEKKLLDSMEEKIRSVPNDQGLRDAINTTYKIVENYNKTSPSTLKVPL